MSRRRNPMVYTRPNTTSLWLKYYDAQGHLIRRSAGTTDQGTAQKILEERLKEVEQQQRRHAGSTSKVKLTVSKTGTTTGGRERMKLSLVRYLNTSDPAAVEAFADGVKKRVLQLFLSGAASDGPLSRGTPDSQPPVN